MLICSAGYLNGVSPELLEFMEWDCVIGHARWAGIHSQRGAWQGCAWLCWEAHPRVLLRTEAGSGVAGKTVRAPHEVPPFQCCRAKTQLLSILTRTEVFPL